MRDVAIGVAIAVVVLGGFLGVKLFVLSSKTVTSPASTAAPATANLKVSAAADAELFIDDNKVELVAGQEVTVNAGRRKVRIVTAAGACEREIDLPGGQRTPFECTPPRTPPPEAGAAGSAAGSATRDADAGSAAQPMVTPEDTKPADKPLD